jgi:putative protein kinase ArgK-like GTPase of G3E family
VRRLRTKAPVFTISAATGEGCRELMWAVHRFLAGHRRAENSAPAAAEVRDPRFESLPSSTA